MAGTPTFCTLADVLALVSYDAQARLATDPQMAVPLAARGDGTTTLFTTPFMLATTLVVTVGGVPTTAFTLIPGAGTDGRDKINFSVAPALGALITVKADIAAINLDVVQLCIQMGADKMAGYLSRYGTTLPDDVRASLKTANIFLTRWFLRSRKNLAEQDPIILEYKSMDRWLENVGLGKIALAADAPVATAPLDTTNVHAEAQVFEAPFSADPTKDYP